MANRPPFRTSLIHRSVRVARRRARGLLAVASANDPFQVGSRAPRMTPLAGGANTKTSSLFSPHLYNVSMISNFIPGLYPRALSPIDPGAADGPLPGFQSRFQKVLEDAEALYGPRDTSWNVLGLEVLQVDAAPAVATSPVAGKNCVLRISEDVNEAEWLMDWQLSHEIVHLLSPPSKEDATIFEEGVASYNQHRIAWQWHGRYHVGFKTHQQAFDLVRPLIEAHPEGVRDLRAANGRRLSPVTSGLIQNHFPCVTAEDAAVLASRFYV